MLGGVCAGLARRWQVDPNVLRIGVVALTFLGGFGLALYLAGLLLMPRDGQRDLPARRLFPFTRSWPTPLLVALVLGVFLVVAGITSGGLGFGSLVVLGVVGFFGFRSRPQPPADQRTPSAFDQQAAAWRSRLAEQQVPGFENQPPPPITSPPEAPWQQPYSDPTDAMVADSPSPDQLLVRPTATGHRLWWVALILAGLGGATVTAVDLVVGVPASALAYGSVVLGALGITLVWSAWSTRPRLLLPLTVAVAVATATLAVPAGTGTAFADQNLTFTGQQALPAQITHQFGDLRLDLSQLELASDQTLTVDLTAGDAEIILPKAANTNLNWNVSLGSYTGPESGGQARSFDGISGNGSEHFTAQSPTAPTLTLNVRQKLGDLVVRR